MSIDDTKEYVARDENGNVTSRVYVHEVTADDFPTDQNGNRLPLKVRTTGGDTEVQEGAVLVQAQNPSFWDVLTHDTFQGYESADGGEPAAPVAEEPAEPVEEPAGEPVAENPETVPAEPGA